jgi:AAA domain
MTTKTLDQLRRAFPGGEIKTGYYTIKCPVCESDDGKTGVKVEGDHIGGVSCFHDGGKHNTEATAKVYAAIDSGTVVRSKASAQPKRKSLENTCASWGWPDEWQPITETTRAILAASRCKPVAKEDSYTPRLETLVTRGFREKRDKGRIRFAYPTNINGELRLCKSAFCDIREGEGRRKWPQFAPTAEIPTNLLFGIDEAFPTRVWVPKMVRNEEGLHISTEGEWREPTAYIKAPAVFITEGQWDALVLHELGYPAVSIGCDKQKEILPELVERLLRHAHRVYLVPDKGAESTMDDIARLFPPERCFVVEMQGAKDISELRQKLTEVEPSWAGGENLKPIRTALDDMIARKRTGKATEPERVALGYKLTRMSDYKPKQLEFFWPSKIPKNKVAVFAGEPGAAKSLVTCFLAEVQSTGGCFPGEDAPSLKPAEVLMMYCEDDTEDTVLPRLIAVGADTDRVHEFKITKVAKDGTAEERHLALDTDLHLLRQCLRDNPGIRLVTVDPITNYTGAAKITDEKAMREVLTPLKELAAEYEITIILVAHLNKRSDVSALNRVLGAVAMTGVARSAWIFAADDEAPDDGFDHGLMLQGKTNNSRRAKQGLKYTVKTKKLAQLPEDALPVPYIEWNGESDMTADDALDTSSGKKSEKAVKRHEAEALLKSVLANGPKFVEEVENIAAARHVSDATLRRAKKSLKVQWGKEKGKQDGRIYWHLPGDGRLPTMSSNEDGNF